MNICVTGGAGFIASHIVDKYISLGHSVVVLDNLSSGKIENLNPKAKFVNIDINDDRIKDIFEQERFDVVSHHAAQMNVRFSVDDPRNDAMNNIIGSLSIFEAAVKTGVKKVIFSSSGGTVYGEQFKFPADENEPTNPCSPYGIAKLSVEKYLFYYLESLGLEHVILRYANVYGPRQNPKGEAGVVAIFIGKMLSGEMPVINGDGLITRDYVFVADVVEANVLALQTEVKGTFNIGTAIETNVNDIFRKLKSITGSTCDEFHGPAKLGEQRRSVIDISKFKRLHNWSPKVSIDDGLLLTVESFKR